MSRITFIVRLPSQSSDADKLLMRVTRGIVASLTGLDRVRQECLVTLGDPRECLVTIHEARIDREWLRDAEILIQNGLLHAVRWFGELGLENPTKIPNPIDSQWHIVPEKTYTGSVHLVNQSPMGKLEAATRWDGCTHLWVEDEDQEDGQYYQHICDLDIYIAYLQACREKSRRYFGGEFSLSPINETARLRKIKEFQQAEQAGV